MLDFEYHLLHQIHDSSSLDENNLCSKTFGRMLVVLEKFMATDARVYVS